jgi:hypothetical protein
MDQYKIQQEPNCVRLWTRKRLPFEPKGEMLDARSQLRVALSKLALAAGECLEADFYLEKREYFDLENVLFYNVGTSNFSNLLTSGLTARIILQAPSVTSEEIAFPYLQKYSAVCKPNTVPDEPPTLSFELPEKVSLSKPDRVWWAASQGTAGKSLSLTGRFGMVVEYPSSRFRIHNAMKPLLDGIIAAMHSCDEADSNAIDRLAKKNSWEADKVNQYLKSPSCPILGPRKVLHLYREHIKWDPADDRCTEFKLVPSSNNNKLIRVWMYETES